MRTKWFLMATLFGLMISCRGGQQDPVPAGPFTLAGTVTIVNDCDRQPASIPNNITVSASLQNAAGNVAVPGTTNIALAPAAGGGASKSGNYSITVQWPGGPAGAPVNWGDFNETLVGGGDICGPIRCEVNRCSNVATRTRTAPILPGNPRNTTNDVRIRCACGP